MADEPIKASAETPAATPAPTAPRSEGGHSGGGHRSEGHSGGGAPRREYSGGGGGGGQRREGGGSGCPGARKDSAAPHDGHVLASPALAWRSDQARTEHRFATLCH